MSIYAFTLFISAILLFQVQLIIAKYILPWFGGTPAVWSTCMLFFQVMLTAGYAYSHGAVSKFSVYRQTRIHMTLLAASIILLGIQVIFWQSPILPGIDLRQAGSDMPILRILGLLTVCVGLPFFILSSTTSLLQSWFSREFPKRSPYKLFALSNAGSLLGLLSYPFLVEPNLGLSVQAILWFVLYVLFALFCGYSALKFGSIVEMPPVSDHPAETTHTGDSEESDGATWQQQILWLALTAGASIVMLATTNQVSEEVAVIPFLWTLPLSVYLLTFILCFSSRSLYWRPLFVIAGIVILYFSGSLMFKMLEMITGDDAGSSIHEQLMVYYSALFICGMLCHGELVRLKPSTRHLTQFYLSVSIGGALGGIFVGFIAPTFFQGLWELYIGYFICGLAVLMAVMLDRSSLMNTSAWGWLIKVPATVIVLILAVAPFFLLVDRLPQFYRNLTLATAEKINLSKYLPMGDPNEKTIAIHRNFYGILRVVETYPLEPQNHQRYLYHGQTLHGYQYADDDHYRELPTTYYTKTSGVGVAIVNHPRHKIYNPQHDQRVGIVGLGAGTLAVYGRKGDYYRIYEINPAIAELSASEKSYFSYVPECRAEIDVVIGDARISMEHERAQQFDVLALDAFSGDAPPTHLLTQEAFHIYISHMREGGIIAVHITNRYIDFKPLIWKIADELGLERILISAGEYDYLAYDNDWILLTRDKDLFKRYPFINRAESPPDKDEVDSIRIWTDYYSNIYQLLK